MEVWWDERPFLKPKLGKRLVDRVRSEDADFFLWDCELLGFGLRVYLSSRLTIVIQFQSKGRRGPFGRIRSETHRLTIRLHSTRENLFGPISM